MCVHCYIIITIIGFGVEGVSCIFQAETQTRYMLFRQLARFGGHTCVCVRNDYFVDDDDDASYFILPRTHIIILPCIIFCLSVVSDLI